MKQEALKNFDLPWLPVTALILFVVCFSLYCWWAYRKENRALFSEVAQIPLQDASLKMEEKGLHT